MNMSKTEVVAQMCSTDSEKSDVEAYNIMYSHARQLETQIQELREALALLIVASDHKCGVAEQANHARAVLERTK